MLKKYSRKCSALFSQKAKIFVKYTQFEYIFFLTVSFNGHHVLTIDAE